MSAGGLDSTGVAFAALSIAPAPGHGMEAPDGPPIAWPDHPLAVSGGEILATRILPLMGHNTRDFARAAAVCRGWRAACRAATPNLSVYRETVLQPIAGESSYAIWAWSPCGKFVAAALNNSPRLFIWRASTGALVNEWALVTPATAVPPYALEDEDFTDVVFSRDGERLLTFFEHSDYFAVWSVPDGRLLAVNQGSPDGSHYEHATFGVPGSASDGLVGFISFNGSICLWDVPPPTEGGPGRPRLRSRVDLALDDKSYYSQSFALSSDGSKFAATHAGVVYVYDVASLTRLGVYTSPSNCASTAWHLMAGMCWCFGLKARAFGTSADRRRRPPSSQPTSTPICSLNYGRPTAPPTSRLDSLRGGLGTCPPCVRWRSGGLPTGRSFAPSTWGSWTTFPTCACRPIRTRWCWKPPGMYPRASSCLNEPAIAWGRGACLTASALPPPLSWCGPPLPLLPSCVSIASAPPFLMRVPHINKISK